MIVYEKENKLNINFENSVSETPDVQIGKDGDKTQILVDGQESGSGSGANVLTLYVNNFSASQIMAYKNLECTEQYSSYDEASDAIRNAVIVQIVQIVNKSQSMYDDFYQVYTATGKTYARGGDNMSVVGVTVSDMNGDKIVYLWYRAPQ